MALRVERDAAGVARKVGVGAADGTADGDGVDTGASRLN